MNSLESDVSIFLFVERTRVDIDASVLVNFVDPGDYVSYDSEVTAPRAIPTAAAVYLLHADPVGAPATMRYQGWVSFPYPVLGIIVSTGELAASDTGLGADGTTYGSASRGLDTGEDTLTLRDDRRTIVMDWRADIGSDQARVLTGIADVLE